MPSFSDGRREADVRVDRDHGRAGVALRGEVDLVELGMRAERRAAVLDPADRELLVGEARAVPRLDQHPDPAGDEVRAALRATRARPRSTQTCCASASRLLGLDVVRAVLEPHQVARRLLAARRRGRAAEPELRPAHDDDAAADPGQVADGVERDLRVVRARLHADVAAGAVGSSVSSAKAGSSTSAAGRLRGEAEPVLPSSTKRLGPKPIVTVRRAAAVRAPRRCRRAGRPGRRWPARPARPAVIRAAAVVHVAQHVAQLVAAVGDDVEGREVEPVLRRRRDAGLVRAVERDPSSPSARVAAARQLALRDHAAADRERRAADAGRREQRAAASQPW